MDAAILSRGAARQWITKSGTVLRNTCADPTATKCDVEVALSDFDDKVNKLNIAQQRVEDLFTIHQQKEMFADIEDASIHYEEKVKSVLKLAKNRLDSFSVKIEEDTQSVHSNASTYSVNQTGVDARLPKLKLKNFSGDQRDWSPWWEQFKVMVDDKLNIPAVTKFAYLRSLLQGSAKAVIEGLSLTAANYEAACELLKNRYGRPDREIFTHISDLLAIEVPPSPSVEELWALYNSLQSHVRSLAALEITGTQYGVILTPLILSRIPDDLRMEWVREGERKERREADADDATSTVRVGADLDFLMEFLRREVQHRETSATYSRASTGQLDAPSPATAAALHTSNKKLCSLCSTPHQTHQCRRLLKLNVQERREKLMGSGICLKCLQKSTPEAPHKFKLCRSKCSKCSGSHHSFLCSPSHSKSKPQFPNSKSKHHSDSVSHDTDTPQNHSVSNTTQSKVYSSSSDTNVLLQTLKVSVKGRKTVKANILFDTGSDRTYVSQSLVDRVQPEWIEQRELSFASFGSKTASSLEKRNVYNLLLQGPGEMVSVQATSIPIICSPLTQPKVPTHLLSKLGEVVPVTQGQKMNIDILIGLDHYWKIVNSGPKFLTPQLVAQDTALGCMLSGRLPSNDGARPKHSISSTLFCREIPERSLQAFWDLESVGINIDREVEDPVVEKFKREVIKEGDRYSVALPWKENSKPHLVNNRRSAMKRLQNLSNRLEKDEDLKNKYHEVFTDMLGNGMIEEVPTEEKENTNPVFYLPHHPVIKHASTTTKVRPVFDASAKGYNGVSLNDCMHAGPNYLPDLPGLLMRFRRWNVALTADVTKAFLQVGVKEEDRDVHRFLWDDKGTIRTMRFTRVPFGNKGSPFLLMATIRHHLSSLPPSNVVNELHDNTYMDDWLSGSDSDEEAQKMFTAASQIMKEASMSLAKWGTNSQTVSKMFTEKTEDETLKVLGMKWSSKEDSFSFSGLKVEEDVCLTKRLVLSLISRLFDPLGFLTPFTITVKCLFQQIWKLQLDWDQILPDTIQVSVRKWLKDLDIVKTLRIPRRFSGPLWSETVTFQLHGFGDASEQAYGACVYILKQDSTGKSESSLVASRAKVAPLKMNSISRNFAVNPQP